MIIFGVGISSSVHIDNKKKDILILGKFPTQGLDDTSLTAEKEYSINFTEQQKKFCLSLHYNIFLIYNIIIYLLMVLKYINSKQKILK